MLERYFVPFLFEHSHEFFCCECWLLNSFNYWIINSLYWNRLYWRSFCFLHRSLLWRKFSTAIIDHLYFLCIANREWLICIVVSLVGNRIHPVSMNADYLLFLEYLEYESSYSIRNMMFLTESNSRWKFCLLFLVLEIWFLEDFHKQHFEVAHVWPTAANCVCHNVLFIKGFLYQIQDVFLTRKQDTIDIRMSMESELTYCPQRTVDL